jgi:hypothetical protein
MLSVGLRPAGGGGVPDRLFVDLPADGQVSVSTWLDGDFPGGEAGERTALAWPLDADALDELGWYLEDYLRGCRSGVRWSSARSSAQDPRGTPTSGCEPGSPPPRPADPRARNPGSGGQLAERYRRPAARCRTRLPSLPSGSRGRDLRNTPMNDPAAVAARSAAEQLEAGTRPGLVTEVEVVLATRNPRPRRRNTSTRSS